MNMKKRMLVLLFTVVMLVGMLPTAFAADLTVGTNTADVVGGAGNSVVTVDAEPVQMTVTVPSVLPASIDTQGNVTVATDAEIRNQSYGPVTVSAIKAEGLNGWSLAGADYSFAKAKVGTKAVQVTIDGAVANDTTGAIVVPDKWIISGGDSYGFGYGLKIPAQKVAIPSAQPAKIIFTVDWYEGQSEPVTGEDTETGEINSLSLDKDYIAMYPDTSETIHATATTEQMTAMLAAFAGEEPVEWESTNEGVASVEGGKVAAHALGRTTIRANYKGITATCAIQVKEAPIPLEAIGFSKDIVTLMKGESETVLLSYNPDKFTGAADVTFSVDGDAVSVQPTALSGVTADAGSTPVTITATGSGKVVIKATATVDGKTVTAQMTAQVMVPLESLTIAGETSVVEGETITLTATKNPSNTTDTNKITWSSSDESIATVDADGVVTGVAEGEVVITAKCGGISANWSVMVESTAMEASIDWEYTTDDTTGTITLTEYIGASNDVVVYNQYTANGKNYSHVVLGESKLQGVLLGDNQGWAPTGPFIGSAKRGSISSITLKRNVELPENSSYMLNSCSSLSALIMDGSNTKSAVNMSSFICSGNLVELDVSNWDTSNVTNMAGMFSGCSALATLDASNWDTGNVTDMRNMFFRCEAITVIDASGWETSSVKNMSGMFRFCTNLIDAKVSEWDTSSVTDIGYIFGNCQSIEALDISNWNTSAVTTMDHAFYDCTLLKSLDVSGWNTSAVKNMNGVFALDSSFTEINVSGWDTSSVTNMGGIFRSCTALVTIYASPSFVTTAVSGISGISDMFTGCTKLVGGNGTVYNSSYTGDTYARIDTASTPGYFTAK